MQCTVLCEKNYSEWGKDQRSEVKLKDKKKKRSGNYKMRSGDTQMLSFVKWLDVCTLILPDKKI